MPKPTMPSHGQIILNVLGRYGPSAPFEIAGYCNLDAHEIGRRMSELRKARLIRLARDDDGVPVQRQTPKGRLSRVFEVGADE